MDQNKETHSLDQKKVFQILNVKKVWIPLLLGLGIVFYLFLTDPDIKASHLSLIKHGNLLYIFLAVVLVLCRDVGYMYRLRLLSNHQLSWAACFYVILLWEFSSAVTPSVVGGTVVAVYLIFKEGIDLAKSLAYVMITAIFDNLFFIVFAPLGFMTAHNYVEQQTNVGINFLFWTGYSLTFLYTALSAFALFIHPHFFKWLLVKITSIKFLKRWQSLASKEGDDIILASSSLKNQNKMYWIRVMLITVVIWFSRYAIVNALMTAYVPVDLLQHVLIFGKQVIIWVGMLLSPTPGSTGTAEFFFKQFYGTLLGDYVLITAVLWRLITYYFYLFLGVFILPRWLKRISLHE